jgi:hypothetical protein
MVNIPEFSIAPLSRDEPIGGPNQPTRLHVQVERQVRGLATGRHIVRDDKANGAISEIRDFQGYFIDAPGSQGERYRTIAEDLIIRGRQAPIHERRDEQPRVKGNHRQKVGGKQKIDGDHAQGQQAEREKKRPRKIERKTPHEQPFADDR